MLLMFTVAVLRSQHLDAYQEAARGVLLPCQLVLNGRNNLARVLPTRAQLWEVLANPTSLLTTG